MRSLKILIGITALISITVADEVKKPLVAVAYVEGSDRTVRGNVTFTQNDCGENVYIEISITGLTPGLHGFHVHEKGDLTNGCASTGGHYNPDRVDHGAPKDEIRHVGDLGNIEANADRVANTVITDHVITLHGPRSIIGRGIVIHSDPDDLGKTDHVDSKKTGNAGSRVACGVIGIKEPSNENYPCQSSGTKLFQLGYLQALILPIIYSSII